MVPYPANTTPSQRFRLEQWMPILQAEGIEVKLAPFADAQLMGLLHQPGHRASKAVALANAFLRRAVNLTSVRKYDAVFLHRAACIAGPALIERLIPLMGCPVIYDFDDAIFMLHTTEANRRFGWMKFPGKTAAICGLSAQVVVGNSYLADYARQYNSRVTVIPTSVDTKCYQAVKKRMPKDRVVIGWTGSSTSQTHLEIFAPVLREILADPRVELRVISNRQPQLKDIKCIWRPWSPETETEELAHFDIGIMPMPDDEWALGKCALKALQYMAMGIPTICSAVGANREVIQHGKNGLLSVTDDDWRRNIQLLVNNADLRVQLGAEGRVTIEREYSMTRCAGLLAGVVKEVTGRNKLQKSIDQVCHTATTQTD